MRFPEIKYPDLWRQVFDQFLPLWVKARFSPDSRWKLSTFTRQDAVFFAKSVVDLTELLTEERPFEGKKRNTNYFAHPRYRSAYFLYLFQLQAAKFFTLFEMHRPTLQPLLQQQRIRILDVGAGPGTGSFALVLWILNQKKSLKKGIPEIELHWMDSERKILEDGQAWVEYFCEKTPEIGKKISTHLHPVLLRKFKSPHPQYDLILSGHILNEFPSSRNEGGEMFPIVDLIGAGGLLLLEPAIKTAAQKLSKLRDSLFIPSRKSENDNDIDHPDQTHHNSVHLKLVGPCLHQGICPLREGRDWCHFSVAASIPGSWFRFFSLTLGSERDWLKFSYLWVGKPETQTASMDPGLRRVVSDVIPDGTGKGKILLCEPKKIRIHRVPPASRVLRGDLISVSR